MPGAGTAHTVGTVVAWLAVLLLVQAVSAPAWLVALRARPLPPDQRERLLDLARCLGVRVRDIRSFPGRGQKVANALQIGLLPRLRYVLVSDHLLDHMTEREVDSVLAHELGHARGHHLLVKLLAPPPGTSDRSTSPTRWTGWASSTTPSGGRDRCGTC